MRTPLFLTAALLLVGPAAQAAEANFLGKSTYTATAADCAQLQALARGTAKPSLTTVPESLSAKGYKSWEGGCTISSTKPNRVRQAVGIKSWTVNLVCSEGAVENKAVKETWRINGDGSVSVSGNGKSQRYSACAVQAKGSKR